MKEQIYHEIDVSRKVREAMLQDDELLASIEQVAQLLIDVYRAGGKSLWAGNGGSAADAQHMAAELVNKLNFDRPGLPALALTTDSSILTSIGNDYAYEEIFSRQIRALGKPGDVFIGISTSGNSRNLVSALQACREKGLITVALTGSAACAMDVYDHLIKIPSRETPRIQECQTLVGHILCAAVESALFAH